MEGTTIRHYYGGYPHPQFYSGSYGSWYAAPSVVRGSGLSGITRSRGPGSGRCAAVVQVLQVVGPVTAGSALPQPRRCSAWRSGPGAEAPRRAGRLLHRLHRGVVLDRLVVEVLGTRPLRKTIWPGKVRRISTSMGFFV